MKSVFKLIEMKDHHTITGSSDGSFLFLIQHAALLGLKETGCMNEMQYRQAENMLLEQYREEIRADRSRADKND